MRVVDGDELETGAIVVPLQKPKGCAGVLALELRSGGERRDSVCAVATILAAQLSTLVACPAAADEQAAEEGPVASRTGSDEAGERPTGSAASTG